MTQQDFERHWLTEEDQTVEPDIKAIRDYAYLAFDHLDKNGNGFLEREELVAALELPITTREKSFITFLLNNQENIAEMVNEGVGSPADGISRGDLETYFSLITRLLG
jgi:Ca2+-binding EF-hand superfamily protein